MPVSAKAREMAAQWRIDRGIPIPPERQGLGPNNGRYSGLVVAMRRLDVGDSIFVAHDKGGYFAVNNSVQYLQRYTPLRFTTRTVEGGIRLWRTEDATN